MRELYTAEFVHGEDGMGDMDLHESALKAEKEHAVDAMLRIIEASHEPMELITLGPLTNVAMACLKAPETMKKLKRVSIMGGAGLASGNITPVAEFNIYVDAEAAQIVINAGLNLYFVGWDVSMGTSFINKEDMQYLINSGSDRATFCVKCNKTLEKFNLERFGHIGFDLPDPATVAAALYDDMVENYEANCYVDYTSEKRIWAGSY